MATVVCPECDFEASRLKNKDLLISLPSEDLSLNEVSCWRLPSFPKASVSSSSNSCPKCGFDIAAHILEVGGLEAYQKSVQEYKNQVEEYLSEYQRIESSALKRVFQNREAWRERRRKDLAEERGQKQGEWLAVIISFVVVVLWVIALDQKLIFH